MKKIISFITCIAIAVIANAQSPTFQWAKSVGGTNSDLGYGVAADAAGNVYTIGGFNGSGDFDPGPATLNFTSAGGEDMFLTKVDVSGNLVWAEQFGAGLGDEGTSIAIDASGNVYMAGTFSDVVDFDPGPGVFNLTSAGSNDIFVSKLDPSGNLVWAKDLGGASYDYALSLALDSSGNVYTTGVFANTADFDPGAAAFNLTSACSAGDIFISKLDNSGNFLWAKDVGGDSPDRPNSITTDISGNVYTAGEFQGTTDFDPGAGIISLVSAGGFDIFILKLDPSGNFLWVRNMGESSNDDAYDVKTDASGNVYSTGIFQSTVDFDPGPGINNVTSNGSYDPFILKLDASGNFLWAKDIGGSGNDNSKCLAIDNSGNVYVTGTFSNTVDFDPGAGIADLTTAGSFDIFILKLDPAGNFIEVEQMGGAGNDQGISIIVDASDNIYTIGDYYGTADFDPGAATFNLTAAGISDVFMTKMSQNITTSVTTENAEPEHISIYPNPTNSLLNVSLPNSVNNPMIEIYNSIGALIYNKQISNSLNKIELTGQSNGIYFIKVMSDDKIIATKKIIKQ